MASCMQRSRPTSGGLCCGFRHSGFCSSKLLFLDHFADVHLWDDNNASGSHFESLATGSNETARCFSLFETGHGDISTPPLSSVTGSGLTFTFLIKSVNCSVFLSNLTAKQCFHQEFPLFLLTSTRLLQVIPPFYGLLFNLWLMLN